MKRTPGGGLRALADCVRPLWRSLVSFGATYAGPAVYFHALLTPEPAPHCCDPVARHARGGPPYAHPERLREDVPLSEGERLLALELWPTHHCERRAPGDS